MPPSEHNSISTGQVNTFSIGLGTYYSGFFKNILAHFMLISPDQIIINEEDNFNFFISLKASEDIQVFPEIIEALKKEFQFQIIEETKKRKCFLSLKKRKNKKRVFFIRPLS